MSEVLQKSFSQVKIITSEYDINTKKKIRDMESINFNRFSPDTSSDIIVIRMNVIGVQKISNIKIGIVKFNGEVVSYGETNSDNTKSSGNIGIERSPSVIYKEKLFSFFPGLNIDSEYSNNNNVSINNLTNNSSEYVYLNIKSNNLVERGYIGYKWFFKFA